MMTPEEIQSAIEYNRTVDPRDSRRLIPGMHPKFSGHNCSKCLSGQKACVQGDPGRCSWPHARND